MRIVVAGASGLIGTALVARLRGAGHDVLRLVRREATAADELRWDPARGELPLARLQGVDAAINLAGAGVGDHRWTSSYRRLILTSRTDTTETLAAALARLDTPPAVLLQASATGVYGDRGEEVLDESSSASDEFLARVCTSWEAAADPAREAGIRVADLRTGLVMAPTGGAFGPLLPLVRLGVGGPFGRGRAWWSWITLEDHLRAVEHLLVTDVAGPVNLVAPEPGRQGDLVRAVGRALGRPTVVPVPPVALRVVLGEFADEVLASRRVVPTALLDSGFAFTAPTAESGAAWLAEQVRSA